RNKRAGTFDRRVGQDAVAQIEDVSRATELAEDVDGFLSNSLLRRKENRRIKVSLQSDTWPELRAKFSEVHAPIAAKNVGSGLRHRRKQMMGGLRVIDNGNGSRKAQNTSRTARNPNPP